jgi:UDP-N-acetylglucosamine 4,6-dehydratase
VTIPSLRDSCVLVTGGTGSIGTALIEELRLIGVRELRVLARHQRAIRAERLASVRFIEADIADAGGLIAAVEGVDVVFHLAALKDVTACETDPETAYRTNVVGTANLLRAAQREPRLHQLIVISSDKASMPSGVLGLTKALVERLVAQVANREGRSFGSVRLGNVWGSSGSVLQRWEETARIEHRIDVTNPSMTRFLMRPAEAVACLTSLARRSFAGEIVAPRMRAYRLGDLAEVFAEERQVVIRMVGARAGEKLHEDLVSSAEAAVAHNEGDLVVIDRRRGEGGLSPVTSADAERVPWEELRTLVRSH